jgi:hypothetical protein
MNIVGHFINGQVVVDGSARRRPSTRRWPSSGVREKAVFTFPSNQ